MTFDEHLEKVVLFGGFPYETTSLFWAFDGTDWEKLHLDPCPPGRKWMLFDSCFDRVIMFGGLEHNLTNLDDIWAYSIIDQATSTPARFSKKGSEVQRSRLTISESLNL